MNNQYKDEIKLFIWVSIGMSVVAVFCLIYSIDISDGLPKWGIFSTLAVISLGGTSIGGFLGFLFGIPKTSQVSDAVPGNDGNPKFLHNTNLEQISDWLTKIIIGITLTEIDKIGDRLWIFSEMASKLIVPENSPLKYSIESLPVFVFFLIICSGMTGFFGGYFTSKFVLHRALQALQVNGDENNQQE
ncbi:hypothetical protein [Methylomonas albis]|uniref:Uncharacterized protein n=2 Tax=Methylomonas albis TaxID=1854563 RepID=A0ABR9D9M3_9GAMM|nr:hypothetical protein [Methylomonas albis]MBD9358612.1 hypothetical protein [Methylomonas albis]